MDCSILFPTSGADAAMLAECARYPVVVVAEEEIEQPEVKYKMFYLPLVGCPIALGSPQTYASNSAGLLRPPDGQKSEVTIFFAFRGLERLHAEHNLFTFRMVRMAALEGVP